MRKNLNQCLAGEEKMYIEHHLEDGTTLVIIARKNTEERLRNTCFRGLNFPRSGNFNEWLYLRQVFDDPIFFVEFLEEIEKLWKEGDVGSHSASIDLRRVIGWESTKPITSENDLEFLESFQPNRHSIALKVKGDRTDILAPKTCDVTVIFEIKNENNFPVVIIHSIYPGYDIGELNGDITSREVRYFFSWEHPGEK